MSNPNYTLEIISHHKKFDSKPLRKYYVDGIETVGAWGDEPFEIRFKNNTWQKIQVKLSVDGTDILTGKPADTEISKDMWVVNGYATLSIKAWPEDHNGGAAFVFTSADNSVAIHTHGDLSSRGIIAAAVFTESYVAPQTITFHPPIVINNHYPVRKRSIYDTYYTTNVGGTRSGGGTFGSSSNSVYQSSMDIAKGGPNAASADTSLNSASCFNDSVTVGESCDSDGIETTKSLEKLVSVGAGQHVDQKIVYVTGLTKPIFSETVRVKYLWWDDLEAKLRTETSAAAQPSGFPGDKERKNIDLKGTPRIGEKTGSFRRTEVQEPVFNRF